MASGLRKGYTPSAPSPGARMEATPSPVSYSIPQVELERRSLTRAVERVTRTVIFRIKRHSFLPRYFATASFRGVLLRHEEFSQPVGNYQGYSVVDDDAGDHCRQNKNSPRPGALEASTSHLPLDQAL
jgi:hypothetical protein